MVWGRMCRSWRLAGQSVGEEGVNGKAAGVGTWDGKPRQGPSLSREPATGIVGTEKNVVSVQAR